MSTTQSHGIVDHGVAARKPGVRFVAGHAKDIPANQGRRSWVQYFDYGVTAATDGRLRAQRIQVDGATKPTGWHSHTCEMQFVYIQTGWMTFRLEDGSTLHMTAGDAVLIPGGYRHTEIGMAEDLDAIEVSLPAEMGTVPCDVPEAWQGREDEETHRG